MTLTPPNSSQDQGDTSSSEGVEVGGKGTPPLRHPRVGAPLDDEMSRWSALFPPNSSSDHGEPPPRGWGLRVGGKGTPPPRSPGVRVPLSDEVG